MRTFEAFTILDITQMWQDGTPPVSGGSLEQPDRLRILTQFVRSQEQEYEAAAIKKAKR